VTARILLLIGAAMITLGGLYDLFAPRLPANLAALCAGNEQARKLARELLRALGGSLAAIGVAVAVTTLNSGATLRPRTLALILLLVVPSEGINSFCMHRVGSPFYIPLAFLLIVLAGVLLAALRTSG
jgi:hypothetical protein